MTQATYTMNKPKNTHKKPQNDNHKAFQEQLAKLPDPMALSQALMNAYQKSQPLFVDMLQQFEQGQDADQIKKAIESFDPDPMNVTKASMNLM
ncbi:MAG: hypothetical protein AAF204_04170, partial [Pseudomonadota bacterium]